MIGGGFCFDAFLMDVVIKVGFAISICFDFGSSKGFNENGVCCSCDNLLGHKALSGICKRSKGHISPSCKAWFLVSSLMKRREIIRNDRIYKCGLDLGASGINPFIHFIYQGAEFVVYDCVVSCMYVLATGHEDRLISSLVDRELTFFKAAEANLSSLSVIRVVCVNKVFKLVRKEGAEGGNSRG